MRPTWSLGTFRSTSGGVVAEENDGAGGGAELGWMREIEDEARGGDEVADALPRPPARVEEGGGEEED